MRPRVWGQRSPLGRWSWWVQAAGPLPVFFWTWEAALDYALDRVLEDRHVNHIHLWD
jgi:hypothetical protein